MKRRMKEQLLEKEQKQVSEEKKKKNEADGGKKQGGNCSKLTESDEEGSSSDEETENDTDTDTDSSDFNIEKDVLASHKKKAFDEITRVEKELALQKTENPNKDPVIQRVYTVKQFVHDIMEAGFSDEYRATTKMTSQNATREDNVRKTMKSLDLDHIINLTKKVWKNLPGWSLVQIESQLALLSG